MVPYSLNPDLTKLDTLEKRNPALSECALCIEKKVAMSWWIFLLGKILKSMLYKTF